MNHVAIRLLTGLASLFMTFGFKAVAQVSWQKIRSEAGVDVYFKQPENSRYYELKAVTEVRAGVHALVAVLKDAGRYDQWMHRAADTRLLDTLAVNDYVYYLRTDLPWPARDRDMVVRTTITPQAGGSVTTLSRNVKGYVPEKSNVNRMNFVRIRWKFTPLNQEKTHIRYYTRFDPGINAPAWLEKQLLHVAPFQTLTHLKEEVQKSRYRNARFNFLEP